MPNPSTNNESPVITSEVPIETWDRRKNPPAMTKQPAMGIHLYLPVFEARKPVVTAMSMAPPIIGTVMSPACSGRSPSTIWKYVGR